jgi:hypothetical protein
LILVNSACIETIGRPAGRQHRNLYREAPEGGMFARTCTLSASARPRGRAWSLCHDRAYRP